jgi:hypothetical protein
MKPGDLAWGALLAAITAILVVPASHEQFIALTKAHPLLMGWLKVAVLATMGELLARRLVTSSWAPPVRLPWRIVVWGCFGVAFAVVFEVFATGTAAVVSKGYLPVPAAGWGARLGLAFWTSTLMNTIFAPTFMALHRITDAAIEGHKEIDWHGFINFVVVKTIPRFWIPAHTVTFLLPPEYRVLMASYLSIALGAILAFAQTRASAPAPQKKEGLAQI